MYILTNKVVTVAPLIAYYSQYKLIADTKSIGSFSIDVCGILIIANIMRIFFWFSTGYATNLFIQSFFVIAIQFLLLDICIKMGSNEKSSEDKRRFWRWNKLQSFSMHCIYLVIFSVIFATGIGILTALCQSMKISHYGTILGLASLTI